MVGNTPVLWIPDLGGRTTNGFWAKLEGCNPGGIKDRAALHMIACARRRGELASGRLIVESTSGTLGLGLALAGLAYRHPVTVVTDPGMEPLMRNLLRAYGARVEVVESPDPVGGWQEARRRLRELLAGHPGAYSPDQGGAGPMKGTLAQMRSFNRPTRLLMINQLTINLGFYMLMPYLSNDLGLAAWLVGLTLGVRNLSQQGMFLLGGSLADRIGYKPMILAGLALRTAGLALLGVADALPILIVAAALTGLAGAAFNPAVRAYLAHEAGDRKVEAFAVFNVFYQLGILAGPLIELLLGGIAFRVTCLVAAGLFAILAVAQAKAPPARPAGRAGPPARCWPTGESPWPTARSCCSPWP